MPSKANNFLSKLATSTKPGTVNWAATVKIDSSFGDVGSNPVNHLVKSWLPKIEEMNTRKVFDSS